MRRSPDDAAYMKLALRLARRGMGATSPNPAVGAVLVRAGQILGRGWHRKAGLPHAEIEALADAARRRLSLRGATLYVTLEPCSTHGRTPPCTQAILEAGIHRVVVGATDPNPAHRGRGLKDLRRAGIAVVSGILEPDCTALNPAFNHWIVHGTPYVTVKAAMTLDGKIATASGESKWITGPQARAEGMRLRFQSDAILVGINTVLQDDPGLTRRSPGARRAQKGQPPLRRIILDTQARVPLDARVVCDEFAENTTVVVGRAAPERRVKKLSKRVRVWICPGPGPHIDLGWLLWQLGSEGVTSLLVEGGGEVSASFLFGRFAHRVAFFYAPKIIGGRESRPAVAGQGATALSEALQLCNPVWRQLGEDLLLRAEIVR